MPNHTRNRWTQDTPNTDGIISLGAPNFVITVGGINSVILSTDGSGIISFSNTTGGNTTNYVSNLTSILRTGMYATPNLNQQQFGTAALQPGPSSVANTSDPSGIRNFPPYANSKNPIYGGITNISGVTPKGIQINWADVIYSPGANAISSLKLGIAATQYVNNVAPSVTSIIAYGTNGLPVAAQTNPYVSRVNVTTPNFTITNDTMVNIQVQVITGATATFNFYGVVLGVSFNYN